MLKNLLKILVLLPTLWIAQRMQQPKYSLSEYSVSSSARNDTRDVYHYSNNNIIFFRPY